MPSYHIVRHHDGTTGNLVLCASDPCSLHGDDDIHAKDMESAYAALYARGNDTGMTKHPRPSRGVFTMMKRVAVPFLLVAMMSSLSACSSPYTTAEDDQNAAESSQSGDYSSKVDELASRLKEKAESAASSDTAKKLKEKAKTAASEKNIDKLKSRASELLDSLKESASSTDSSSTAPTSTNGVPSSVSANTDITMSDLESLKVVGNHGRSSTYNRKDWSNAQWESYGTKSCWSVRDQVIKRQADPGTLKVSSDGCSVVAVSFTDPYSGKRITADSKEEVARDIQIDHVVPVSYMDSNGGASWSSSVKAEYYNDMDAGHLIAVSSSENTSKSDYGPSEYMPTGGLSYQAAYAQDWVAVLKDYQSKGGTATIEQADYNAIMKVFKESGIK